MALNASHVPQGQPQPHQHPYPHPMNTPPEHSMQFPAGAAVANHQQQSSTQAQRPSLAHRRVSSGQPPVSGLSLLKNGGSATSNPGPVTPSAISQSSQQSQPPGLPGMAAFDPGRSPPGSKSLSHVPCKFFRQGACQAGKACPFMHSMDSTTDQTPCKYFQKGNCKFGIKCALAHILPDGRRINRPNFNNGGLQLGPRIMVPEYNNHRASALHNSLLQANMLAGQYPMDGYMGADQKAYEQALYNGGIVDPLYGSPRDDHMSPIATSHRTLGPLDAGLPASLDSNGISYYARHGPIAASVPSKFGMESPPPSLPRAEMRGSALRSLHQSAFGDESEHQENLKISRSPPNFDDASVGQRIMQSHLSRRTRVMSSSFPRTSGINADTWGPDKEEPVDPLADGNFAFEEDFVPSSLQELLTPAERNRRMSRTDGEEMAAGSWHRNSINGPVLPGDAANVPVGSPSSRFGALFSRQKREDDSGLSGLGHVGSPLRSSYTHDSSPPFGPGPIGRPEGDNSSFLTSPNKQIGGGSNLSLHLQRVRRNDSYSGEPSPLGPRSGVNGTPQRPSFDKTPSSSSITGRPFSIDEDTQFYMEDEDISGGGKAAPRKQPGLGIEPEGKELLKEIENLYVR